MVACARRRRSQVLGGMGTTSVAVFHSFFRDTSPAEHPPELVLSSGGLIFVGLAAVVIPGLWLFGPRLSFLPILRLKV